jgi:chemotaxis protein MotB
VRKVGTIIEDSPCPVRVEGHTDDLPIRTQRFPSNWELSTARAVSVLRYFQEVCRIPPEKLSAAGFSQFHPEFPNDTPEHRAANRRVVITFLPPEKETGAGEQLWH